MAGAKLRPGKSLREAAVGVDAWMVYIGCMHDVHLWHKAPPCASERSSDVPSKATLFVRASLGFGRLKPAPPCTRRSLMPPDRKSTRLNSSHLGISYAVFCLQK